MTGPRLTLLNPPHGAEENCYIDSELGVRSVLRAVAAEGSRSAAYFDNGKKFIHTTLLAVDGAPEMLIFEQGPDKALNAALLQSTRVTIVTSNAGVPVQFNCAAPRLTSYKAWEAFQVALPARILRLQRRGYYRLAGEPTHWMLKAELYAGNDLAKATKAWVFDLSCSGLAAGVLASEPLLKSDLTHGCMLELPVQGRIQARLVVRMGSGTVLPHGLEGRRYGLEFVDLGEKDLASIHRYILEQQHKRKITV